MVVIALLGWLCGLVIWNASRSGTFGRWRGMRRLRSAAVVPIAALPENIPARLVGTVTAIEDVLIAPLSGRPCVCYEVRVIPSTSAINLRTLLIHERRTTRFALVDGSARVAVDPRHATFALDVYEQTNEGWFDAPTPQQAELLKRHKQGKQWFFNKYISYRESVVGVGDTVAVYGTAVRAPDLIVSGTKDAPLVISDEASVLRAAKPRVASATSDET